MKAVKGKLGAITMNTLIPLGMFFAIGGVIFFIGTLASKVEAIIDKDSPSRTEYNQMCEQLSSIQKGVDNINIYLRDKK